MVARPAHAGVVVKGSVYGGGNLADVKGNTEVNICAVQDGTNYSAVSPVSGNPVISGNVFGGGKGVADSFVCDKAMVGVVDSNDGNTDITQESINKGTRVCIGNGTVEGAVYGGGEVGRVEWNTIVKIGLATGTSAPVIKKDVFGAGKGVEQYGYSALVRGNTFVTIQGDAKVGLSVYGGGEIASVGKYNIATAEYARSHPEVEEGEPYSLANSGSGYCNVTIQGNAEIGPDNMKMTSARGPNDAGHVFGAGKGVLPYENEDDFNCQKEGHAGEKHPGRMKPGDIWECYDGNENAYLKFVETLALATQTYVTIDGNAFVKGSVYGGSMNGHVQHDTQVTIKGGQIGCGKNTNNRHVVDYPSVWDENFVLPANVDLECDSWPFEGEHLPYDIYKDSDGDGTPDFATDGHTFYGNVFGGGSGYYPYKRNPAYTTAMAEQGYGDGLWHREAGSVGGNTVVNITGGHILTSVYGGNEQTDVGTYIEDENGVRTVSSGGKCTINMTGGTVGVPRTHEQMRNHPVTCYVFGAGKGDQRINFNTWTNVGSTEVNISGDARIYGSTFGGGEDGHVIGNAVTNIGGTVKIGEQSYSHTGVIIGTTGTSGVDGNIFGGGRGFSETALTAGVVGGNVEVNISGGTMLGSVFGGGRLASVGTYFANAESDNYGKMQEGDDHGNITINISGGSIGAVDNAGKLVNSNYTIGDVFGGCKGSATNSQFGLSKSTSVTISEPNAEIPTRINRSVFGGGEAGNVLEAVSVTLNDGIVGEDLYGGGALADTNTGSISVDNYEEAAVVAGETVVTGMYTKTGETYTKIDEADKKADEGTTYYTKTTLSDQHAKTTVNLYGGKIMGDAFGGGLGQKTGFKGGTSDIEATTYGDITVTLGKEDKSSATAFNITYENTGEKDENNQSIQVVKSGRLFGTNNLNGSPKGNVTVNVYKTVAGNVTRTVITRNDKKEITSKAEPSTYEVAAVYGGGNLADYTTAGKKASVIIHTCDVSVQDVYGGGNAASVPETDVLVKGAYEIEHVFGGGNGKDKFKEGNTWMDNDGADVLGDANTLMIGGYIHEAYGGSNEKGKIHGSVHINADAKDLACDCVLELESFYTAGNNADVDGDAIAVVDCMPDKVTPEIYGGAKNANVKGNVELTIRGGTFGKVFGGNNQSGAIFGHIILNIEETNPDCSPIIIDELYGCGNMAAYSVYGYYQDGTDENGYPKYVPRKSANDHVAVTFEGKPHTNPNAVANKYQYDDPVVNIISCTRIGKVFGGGLGLGAVVYGNPTVNINQMKGVWAGQYYPKMVPDGNGGSVANTNSADLIPDQLGEIGGGYDEGGKHVEGGVFGGGNEAEVKGNTTVNIGTATTVQHHISYNKDTGVYTMSENQTVLGANIIGNVYGGGNKANVTGSTKVNIGKKNEE